MLSKCRGRSALSELAGKPGSWGLDGGGSRVRASLPGAEQTPGPGRKRAQGCTAGVRAPHLKVVRIHDAQEEESFEDGREVGARLWRFPAGEQISAPPFVLPSVKWVQKGPPPRVAGSFKRGSARRALCRSPATFLELTRTPGTRRVCAPRREVMAEAPVRPSSARLGT